MADAVGGDVCKDSGTYVAPDGVRLLIYRGERFPPTADIWRREEGDVATSVRWLSGTKLHRGFEDDSGLFTLEGCQKDQVDKVKVFDATAAVEVPKGTEHCKICFPQRFTGE